MKPFSVCGIFCEGFDESELRSVEESRKKAQRTCERTGATGGSGRGHAVGSSETICSWATSAHFDGLQATAVHLAKKSCASPAATLFRHGPLDATTHDPSSPCPSKMSEDVAMTATTLLNGVVGTPSFIEFKKDWTSTPTTNAQNGGQMMTLSPPAGDGAGSAGTQPEATSSQSASDLSGDAEGVWSVDIDQAFQEALAIYPPCGRRKIIISDEGKMYGRNELIARYIKLRCGKTRTRKQVSSHIQVLARKKLRDEQAKKKGEAGLPSLQMSSPPESVRPRSSVTPVPQGTASSSSSSSPASAQTPRIPVLPTVVPNTQTPPSRQPLTTPLKVEPTDQISQQLFLNGLSPHLWNFTPGGMPTTLPFSVDLSRLVVPKAEVCETTSSEARSISSSSLSLLSFTAYVFNSLTNQRTELVKIESTLEEDPVPISLFTDKYPPVLRELFEKSVKKDQFFVVKCWANLNFVEDVRNCQYAVDSFYSSSQKIHLKVSTMACSFSKKAVEKIEAYPPTEAANGHYMFALKSSPMCDYMVQFLSELKKLENVEYMNSVLENFTVLQVVSNSETDETLMVLCFVFEVSRDVESSCSVFRLSA
ncbi:unnamed protein product [Caenorhabditis auriculariae]|uniref:TEA domain-containing protein n=1 Tax=Caenorhabditis auriculariae TaxID=2777116 RepID=A0A8S1HEY6_9PELO|nr:unnamed protein product [Caenorhabditis auriculariae]